MIEFKEVKSNSVRRISFCLNLLAMMTKMIPIVESRSKDTNQSKSNSILIIISSYVKQKRYFLVPEYQELN